MLDKIILQKQNKLFEQLEKLQSVVVAFSGGVDSALLAFSAQKVLQKKAVAITAVSAILSEEECLNAQKVAKEMGISHIEMPVDEMQVAEFVANDPLRCYHCKKYRLTKIVDWAKKNNFNWVIEGSNFDDLADYRPGMKAMEEFTEVKSPLQEAGFTKKEIRLLAKEYNISAWDKPSMPCLATRVCYGTSLTKEALQQVERAENIVRHYCPLGNIRVRHHGNLARLEIDKNLHDYILKNDVAQQLTDKIKELGFSFVTLDLEGFNSGSMNKLINAKTPHM